MVCRWFKSQWYRSRVRWFPDILLLFFLWHGCFCSWSCTTSSLLNATGADPKVMQSIMRHSDINMTMARYTHILGGQESKRKAVEGLPDFSLPSKTSQKALATGTDNRPVNAVQDGSKKLTPKLTPFLTPTPFSGYARSATIGTKQGNARTTGHADKCSAGGKLDSKRHSLSSNDTDKKATRPTGFEPATTGSTVRCQPLWNKDLRFSAH